MPEISITPEYGAHATVVEAATESNATAVVNVTPIYVCDEKSVVKNDPERKSSDFDSCASAPQSSSLESERQELKLQRNLSTGSRRKVRLKRMGSRQNSKTEESDSEEETLNLVLETPKKVKRKTSKASKKSEEKEKPEDFVFVLRLNPNSENQEVTYDFSTKKADEEKDENIAPISASVLIKTKRNIFSPIDTTTKGEILSVTGIEVDSSSEKPSRPVVEEPKKPPLPLSLPQSPSLQRRPPEVSPNIRLMIQKYHKITESPKTSQSPSGSPTIWRSPVFDRRVKLQTAKYQEQVKGEITKSASAGHVIKPPPNPIVEVQKCQSTDSVKGYKGIEEEDDDDEEVYETVLSYDALKKKLMKNLESQKTVIDDISKLASDVERSWALQQMQQQKHVETGAIPKKKIPNQNSYNRSTSLLVDRAENTQPKITRKAETRPLLIQSISVSPDSLSDIAPRSPLSQRAERLKRAKEEFLRNPSQVPKRVPLDDSNNSSTKSKENRLSQISTLSTSSVEIEETILEVNLQGGQIPQKPQKQNFLSKLRKVKLRKDSKELPKQGAVQALCRQSLVADITGESSKADNSNSSSRCSLNTAASGDNVKKSSSHIFARFWKPGKEKLKKSRSLGLLNQTVEVKRKESH